MRVGMLSPGFSKSQCVGRRRWVADVLDPTPSSPLGRDREGGPVVGSSATAGAEGRSWAYGLSGGRPLRHGDAEGRGSFDLEVMAGTTGDM